MALTSPTTNTKYKASGQVGSIMGGASRLAAHTGPGLVPLGFALGVSFVPKVSKPAQLWRVYTAIGRCTRSTKQPLGMRGSGVVRTGPPICLPAALITERDQLIAGHGGLHG